MLPKKRSERYALFGYSLATSLALARIFLAEQDFRLFPDTSRTLEAAILFIIGSILADRLSYLIAARELDDALYALQRRTSVIVPTATPTTRVGNAFEGAAYVEKRLENALSVKNTFLVYVSDRKRTSISDHTKGDDSPIISFVIEHLRKGLSWTDILSPLGKEREKLVRNAIRDTNIRGSLYKAYIINGDSPIMNFIILDFGNREKEVLFGWGQHEAEAMGDVFSSRDRDLVEYFERYFDALIYVSQEIV